MDKPSQNLFIADRLRETARLLEQQGADRFRVAAYRKAADTLDSLDEDVISILQTKGFDGLMDLPGIGVIIGNVIVEMVTTGQSSQLERLRGSIDPESLFRRVPGIGPKLARRIVDELDIDTLEALEGAAHDGRLQRVQGFGARRAAMVRLMLGDMLRRGTVRTEGKRAEPGVDILLDVDREYRKKAEAGTLRRIAPRRFNPSGDAWLPILHTQRGPWQFTVLYSNTALAHKLDRIKDWVLVYFEADSDIEGQRTIATERQGPFKGQRIIRGREKETEEYYRTFFAPPQAA